MDTTITLDNSATGSAGRRPPRCIGFAAAARPHPLLDYVLVSRQIKNDAELSRVLRLVPSVISKIRHGHTSVSAEVMLRIHDAFQIPIAELKHLEASHLAAIAPQWKCNP